MKAAVARARRGERGSLRSASPGRIADEADDTDEEEDEVEVEDETEDAVEDEVEDEAVVAMPDIVKD
ncbi:hypothetical protein [Streptomyces sp. NPDC004267]|uniref:hypothetical protein n=1 Tax=Streptomyces sp. NPDC004267 TaxID=3364694 RepID=UPI0036994AD8